MALADCTQRVVMENAHFVLLCLTLITVWLFRLLLKCKNSQHRQYGTSLPPGSMGLPLLGETLQYITQCSSPELHPFFKQRLERYGPIFKTNLIGQNMIVSLDRELNNYVFQQEGKAFEMWFPNSFMKIMGEENIIRSSGSLHKHSRNMILRVIGHENLKLGLLHDVHRVVQRSLSSWLDRPSIDLKPAISSMTFSVAANRLLGDEASNISRELWKHYHAISPGLKAVPLNIPGTAYHKASQGRKNAMKILKQLLEKRMNATRQEPMDFLDVVIRELKKENSLMTVNYALNLLFVLLFFSSDTTSSALTAAVKFLSDNPKALEQLVDEHRRIQKSRADIDSEFTWEEYKSLKFTSYVIHESLRLANIAPVLFRKAKQDVNINGYTIPEGWIVMPCLATSHLNPTTYEDPTIFNPLRWKNISEPVRGSKDFVAFGSGLRFCVGADLAKLEIAIFLHKLVTKYRWKVISGGNMVFSPELGFPEGFEVQLLIKT
ncbi:hypothetical protein ACP70R_018689 [Stipagrostis hirtigluma subsp. patula]